MPKLLFILATTALAAFALTYLIYIAFRRHRWARYLPGILALYAAGRNLILAQRVPNEGFRDIAHLIFALMALSAALASFATAIYLDRRDVRKGDHR